MPDFEKLAVTAQAATQTLMELDTELDALVDTVEGYDSPEDAPPELLEATAGILELYRQKIDALCGFHRAMEYQAKVLRAEVDRLDELRESVERRDSRLKKFLLWFMSSREIKEIKGKLGGVRRQKNGGAAALVLKPEVMPEGFLKSLPLRMMNIIVRMRADDWKAIKDHVNLKGYRNPGGTVEIGDLPESDYLRDWYEVVELEPSNERIRRALEEGVDVPGCKLERREHVRFS